MKKQKRVKFYTLPSGARVYNIIGQTGLFTFNDTIRPNDIIIEEKKNYIVGTCLNKIKVSKNYKTNFERTINNYLKIFFKSTVRLFKYYFSI